MTILDQARETARQLSVSPGKAALADSHPELVDRTHVITVKGETQGIDTLGSYSYLKALGDYERGVWVRKAIKVLSDNVIVPPLKVKRGKEFIDGHELERLFTDVNDTMSSGDLWSRWTVDMMLAGESPLELIKNGRGDYVEVWPRQPHTLGVVPDKEMARYFKVAEYIIDDKAGKPYPLPPEELIHFKFYNPRNPWRGLSPISAVRDAIAIDQLAQAWMFLFLDRRARPDYAIISPQGLTAGERDDIETKLQQKYGGAGGAYKPIVLEQGVSDIKILSWPPKDMEWLEMRQMPREEIGAIFGVPDGLMGWGQESYDTATKIDGDLRALWVLTIVSLLAYRDGMLTEFFRRVGKLRPDESMASDYSAVDALSADLSNKLDSASKLFTLGYPQNVINDRLKLGLPELDGGDVGYLPFGLAPTTSTRGLTALQLKALGDNRAGMLKAPEYGSPEHKALWRHKDTRLNPQKKQMKKELDKQIKRQGEDVIRNLRESAKDVSGIVILEKAPKASDVFNLKAEIKKFKKDFNEIVSDAVASAGQDELDGLGIEIDFDLNREEVQDVIDDLLGQFAKKVNDTTYNDLADFFKKAEADGLSVPDMIAELDDYFEGRRSDASLERIARTTMTGANGAGDVTAWDQSEVVDEREWLATVDDRTRDDHSDAHGQKRDLDEPFDVGGEELDYPGDPQGSAENIINCRCSQVPIVNARALAAKRAEFPYTGQRRRRALSVQRYRGPTMDDFAALLELVLSKQVPAISQPPAPGMVFNVDRLVLEAPQGFTLGQNATEIKVVTDAVTMPLMLPAPEVNIKEGDNIIHLPNQEVTVKAGDNIINVEPTPVTLKGGDNIIHVKPTPVNTTVENNYTPPVQPLKLTVEQNRKSARVVADATGRRFNVEYDESLDAGPVTKDESNKGEE